MRKYLPDGAFLPEVNDNAADIEVHVMSLKMRDVLSREKDRSLTLCRTHSSRSIWGLWILGA